MTAQSLCEALWALFPDLDRENTVDRVIAGSPVAEVHAVAVCWMPFSSALRDAAARGANVVIAHEPTFYDHWETRPDRWDRRFSEERAAKEALIQELGLAIVRCHDVWDAFPDIGVPDEWGSFLGLGALVAQSRYARVYDLPEAIPAREVAHLIAKRTALRGQKTLGLYGDPERMVKRVGTGTGCSSDPRDLIALGADLTVSVDDILRAWILGEWANDTGTPVVMVNHGVSEAVAMDSLARKVRELCPGVPVEVIDQGCSYQEIQA